MLPKHRTSLSPQCEGIQYDQKENKASVLYLYLEHRTLTAPRGHTFFGIETFFKCRKKAIAFPKTKINKEPCHVFSYSGYSLNLL
jgi:hypothetical protein